MLRTSSYTFLGFQVNGLLDEGETTDFAQTCDRMCDGTLFAWLEGAYGDRLDLSLLGPEERAGMLALFADIVNVGGIRRRYIVERNGLALIAAACLEGAQTRAAPDTWPPDPAGLRTMLREHALIAGPGEVVIVTVPPNWPVRDVRELNDALQAAGFDLGLKILVVPGTAVTVAPVPDVEGVTTGMSDATRYGRLAFALNSLIDDGATLDIAETYAHLEDGTLFGWLDDRFRLGLSLSLFEPADLTAVLARFRSQRDAVSTRAHGIEHNGLALLLAWCLHALCDLQSEPGPAREPRTG